MSTDLSLFLLSIRGTLARHSGSGTQNFITRQRARLPISPRQNPSVTSAIWCMFRWKRRKKGAGEFLILDTWNSMDGLNNFFANPTVQEQAGQIFAQRDPVVWAAVDGFVSYHIPAPSGINDRFVTTARGTVKNMDEARKLHNSAIVKTLGKARKAGNLSHESYFRMAAPGSPEAMEWFGVDVWSRPDEMMGYYEDADFLAGFNEMFTAEAITAVWVHPKGEWAEW